MQVRSSLIVVASLVSSFALVAEPLKADFVRPTNVVASSGLASSSRYRQWLGALLVRELIFRLELQVGFPGSTAQTWPEHLDSRDWHRPG